MIVRRRKAPPSIRKSTHENVASPIKLLNYAPPTSMHQAVMHHANRSRNNKKNNQTTEREMASSRLAGQSGCGDRFGDGKGERGRGSSRSPGTLLGFADNADDRRLPLGTILVTLVGGANEPALASEAATAAAAAGLSGDPGDEISSMTRPPTTEVRLSTALEFSAGSAPWDFGRLCVMIGFESLAPIVARRLRCLQSASDTSSSSSSSSSSSFSYTRDRGQNFMPPVLAVPIKSCFSE